MQKKCKLLILLFIAIFLFPTFIYFGIIWYVDPLKLFHQPFMCKNTSYDNVNFITKSFIDGLDFDSVILGTSLFSNTSAKQASEFLGGRFFNASIWGILMSEKMVVLKYILNKKNIKKIIISLDQGSQPLSTSNTIALNKEVISTYSFFPIFSIYLQDKHLDHIFSFKCGNAQINQDTPTSWAYNKEMMARFGGLKNWARQYTLQNISIISSLKNSLAKIENKEYEFSFNKEYLDKNLLYYFKKYPDIEFILIVPPYFMAQNAIYFQTNVEFQKAQKESLLYLIEQKPKNVKIFAFDNMDFASDVRNYYDLVHFSPQISSDILRFIKNNEGLLDKENFEKYWNEFSALALGFDLKAFYNEFLALIEQ